MEVLYKLIEMDRLFEAYIAARYCYRVGLPTLPDDVYDQIEQQLKAEQYERCKSYLERSYDDDPVPSPLLKVLGIEEVKLAVPNELYTYLEEEKSNSIAAIRSYEEAYEFAKENAGKEFMFSLKMDGVNGKTLYTDGEYRLTLSRGRGGNSLDYTQGARRVLPSRVNAPGVVKITGEFFVDKEALPRLREKYDPGRYKTCKSSAVSMLRVAHDEDDYKDLNMMAFAIEGKTFESVHEEYDFLESVGYKTPPHFIDTPPTESLEVISDWLKESVFQRLAEFREKYPSDGVVMEVDSLTEVYEEKNQYTARQKALKFEQWGFEYMRGRITDIIIKQQRVYKSVRIKIEPIFSSDGCKAEYINGFNPGIIIENDLYVGKEVWFERNAGAVNILIHGERLQGLKGEGDDECS